MSFFKKKKSKKSNINESRNNDDINDFKKELKKTKKELKILKSLFNELKSEVKLLRNEIKSNNIDNDSRDYNDKPMMKWNANDIISWIHSLDTLKKKERKTICQSIADTGCYGKTLTCAPNATYLKDRFNISLKVAKKLLQEIKAYNDDDSDVSDSSDDSNDDSDISDSDADDNEEDVLARMIARNLQKKNKVTNIINDNSNRNTYGSKLFSWGNNNLDNNNYNNTGYNDTRDKFSVHIQGSNGKYITIETKCTKHTKVRQIKQYLAAQEGGDPCKMNLKFNGRSMDDNQNLGFYGIANSRNLITVSYMVTGS